jgi:acetoin utilization protein AcuB
MRLQDIMSQPVETIAPTTPVGEAKSTMKRRGVHHLVVTAGRKIAGVVSARDLVGAAADEEVSLVMADQVVTAPPRATVREAANLLRGQAVGCLPVVSAGRVVGIVTISDLLELLGKGAQRPVEESVSWTLRARAPRKGRPTADRKRLSYAR